MNVERFRENREAYVKVGIEGFDEILRGFPAGGLIVVSGSPGTGKTTLAASFIYNGIVKYGEPGVYASMIEDEKRFHHYMKSFGFDFEKLKEKGLFRYLALPTILGPGIGSSVNLILENIEMIGAKRLVIDSYTAISQMFKDQAEARTFLHTCFSKIIRQLDCTAILIREESSSGDKIEHGFEEFIADGLIHLKTDRIENRLIRELSILKMRGCQIEDPDICFTLYQGFKALPPTKITRLARPSYFKPLPDPANGYTTGIPDLDREIGGFPDKSIILIEADPMITQLEFISIWATAIASYIFKGIPCVYIPPGGTTSEDLRSILRKYGLGGGDLRKYLNFPLDEIETTTMAIPAKTSVEDSYQIFEKLRKCILTIRGWHEKPPIRIIGVDRLAHIFGELFTHIAYHGVDDTKKYGGLLIWILKPAYPWLAERLAPLADIHLRITRRHGCLLLHGIKPRTPLYAIRFEEGKMPPKLIPIM